MADARGSSRAAGQRNQPVVWVQLQKNGNHAASHARPYAHPKARVNTRGARTRGDNHFWLIVRYSLRER
jgi:hypothetical protein